MGRPGHQYVSSLTTGCSAKEQNVVWYSQVSPSPWRLQAARITTYASVTNISGRPQWPGHQGPVSFAWALNPWPNIQSEMMFRAQWAQRSAGPRGNDGKRPRERRAAARASRGSRERTSVERTARHFQFHHAKRSAPGGRRRSGRVRARPSLGRHAQATHPMPPRHRRRALPTPPSLGTATSLQVSIKPKKLPLFPGGRGLF